MDTISARLIDSLLGIQFLGSWSCLLNLCLAWDKQEFLFRKLRYLFLMFFQQSWNLADLVWANAVQIWEWLWNPPAMFSTWGGLGIFISILGSIWSQYWFWFRGENCPFSALSLLSNCCFSLFEWEVRRTVFHSLWSAWRSLGTERYISTEHLNCYAISLFPYTSLCCDSNQSACNQI